MVDLQQIIDFYNTKGIKGNTRICYHLKDVSDKFEIEYSELIKLLEYKITPHVYTAKFFKESKINKKDIAQYLADYYFLKGTQLQRVAAVFNYSCLANCSRAIKFCEFYRNTKKLTTVELIEQRKAEREEIKKSFPEKRNYWISLEARKIIDKLPDLDKQYKSLQTIENINQVILNYLSTDKNKVLEDIIKFEQQRFYSKITVFRLNLELAELLNQWTDGNKKKKYDDVLVYQNRLISNAIEANADRLGITTQNN